MWEMITRSNFTRSKVCFGTRSSDPHSFYVRKQNTVTYRFNTSLREGSVTPEIQTEVRTYNFALRKHGLNYSLEITYDMVYNHFVEKDYFQITQ